MKKLIILFQNLHDIVKKAKELGYDVLLIGDTPSKHADQFIFLAQEDANNLNFDLQKISFIDPKTVHGVIACHEYYVELAALVRERLFPGHKGLSVLQTQETHDKLLMKKAFQKYGIPCAKFSDITESSVFSDLSEKIGIPFLIKPRKDILARNIQVIRNAEDFDRFMNSGFRNDGYYAEEYLQNVREYCCDTLVSDRVVLAQFTGEYLIPCLVSSQTKQGFGVNFPGFLEEQEIQEAKEIAARFIKAHDIRDGFCHIEFMLHNGEWKLGELGIRLPGGLQIQTESVIAGEDLLRTFLETLCDASPSSRRTLDFKKPFSGYYLYPKPDQGKISTIKVTPDNKNIESLNVLVHEGETLSFESTSTSTSANVIYSASDIHELRALSEASSKWVEIGIEHA